MSRVLKLKKGKKVEHLSAGFSCTFCDDFAPTHNNGKFKYVVIFSQTGEWGMCCEKCAEKGAQDENSIDSWFYQDENGLGFKWGEMPQNEETAVDEFQFAGI